MPTNFPTSLDSFSNPGPDTSMNAPGLLHNEQHSNLNDAVEALQAKVGVNGSLDANSLEFKFNSINSSGISEDPIWDAGGDLVIGSGANSAVKLSKGAALSYLRVNAAGTTLEYGDLAETVADHVGSMLTGNTVTGITIAYQDSDNTIDFTVTDSPLLGGQSSSYHRNTDNHTSGTTNKVYTATEQTKLAGIATGATANSTDAQLRNTDTHTSGTTNKVYTATEQTKLAGIATGATANATDAQLRDRSTHTGTQAASTITGLPVALGFALSDEATNISVGTGKLTVRMPHAMTLTAVRTSLTVASTSGVVTVNVKEGGVTVLSTKPSIDANEKTSQTGTVAVISDSTLADDAEITFDIDAAGTGAKGLKVWLIGTR